MVTIKLINKIIYNIPNCISQYDEDGEDTIEWAQKLLKGVRDMLEKERNNNNDR